MLNPKPFYGGRWFDWNVCRRACVDACVWCLQFLCVGPMCLWTLCDCYANDAVLAMVMMMTAIICRLKLDGRHLVSRNGECRQCANYFPLFHWLVLMASLRYSLSTAMRFRWLVLVYGGQQLLKIYDKNMLCLILLVSAFFFVCFFLLYSKYNLYRKINNKMLLQIIFQIKMVQFCCKCTMENLKHCTF